MRPERFTPAHSTPLLAELVCSNSLRADSLENAAGLLKEEMRLLNSIIIKCADMHRVPAGGALAVDRQAFSREVSRALERHPNIEIIRKEVTELPEGGVVIVATGPLTSPELSERIKKITGEDYLYFYDAAAPIVTAESINFEKVFRASRYGKGGDDYLNCPLTEEEYYAFYRELIKAEKHSPQSFEKEVHFEGCMPIEEMASRGPRTLLFGPLKPAGLVDENGCRPFAVVQLRQDNKEGTLYNMVGFQTRLKWKEQQRVFCMIPALEKAEFVRYGVMHRNTFINSPLLLTRSYCLKNNHKIYFAGQITGVEGYIESAASGLIAGINASRVLDNKKPLVFPPETAHGALSYYITSADPHSFQPMNINFGLFPPLATKVRSRKLRNQLLSERSLRILEDIKKSIG